MFEKIVVAIDGSQAAANALNIACDMASKYNSALHLVHTPQLETTAIAVGSGAVEIEPDPAKVEEAGKFVMDSAVKQAESNGCTPGKCVIGNGDPAEEILKELESANADLVVMGRRGLGRVSSLLLGSVSQKVSTRSCRCTVHRG